jgi:predicted phage tail protein
VYIAWDKGSAGGGRGGVVAGAALLVAAVVRLMLPARLAGLLASRRRVTDVLMLTAFGASLLIAGLVLPSLGPLSAQGEWPARR